VRVRERGDGSRFLLEARASVGIRCQVCREDLECDVATEPRVARLVHLAHATGADRGKDLVGTQPESGCEGHLRHSYAAS
jgi:hypothetical protein